MIEFVSCAELREPPNATWSNALKVDGQVHVSGLHAMPWAKQALEAGAELSTYEQSVIIFRKLEQLLAAAGSDLSQVYKLVIYAREQADKDAVNRARQEFFRPPYPCSTFLLVSGFAFEEVRLEIEGYALS